MGSEADMADIEYTQVSDPAPTDSGAVTRLTNFAGAVVSLGLVIGVGIWGYQLLSRDVSGVPVVRALEGPMRVQPDDPGGRQADHQGLAVNAVAAAGTAAEPADRLMLARKPVDFSDEDMPVNGENPVQTAAEIPSEPVIQLTPEVIDASVDALVEQLVAGVKPLDASPVETSATAIVQPEPLVAVVAALPEPEVTDDPAANVISGPGLARSLRPQPRPQRAVQTGATPQPQDAAAVVTLDVDPATLPAGTRLAQLGAYDSAEVARSEWDRLSVKFEDYLEGKKRVVQKANSGGRTFYRLRAMGFVDMSDARRFCAVLVAENTDCIPVTTR